MRVRMTMLVAAFLALRAGADGAGDLERAFASPPAARTLAVRSLAAVSLET